MFRVAKPPPVRRKLGGATLPPQRHSTQLARLEALHRLERAGCVEAEWGLSESNRRARYYRSTARGRQRFRAEEASWRRYAEAVFRVLEPA
jgi:hypothetical protein